MKKLLGITAACALTVSAFAQGTVGFQNLTGLVKQWTSTADSTLMSATKGNAMVDLISAAVGVALPNPLGTLSASGFALGPNKTLASFLAANPGWHSEAVGGVNSANGIFNNGTVSLTGIAGGASAQYLILGWTGTAATLDLAITGGAFIGESAIFTTTTGDPNTTPPGTPINLKATFTGLTLAPTGTAPIPEPASFALLGLGAAAMLIFRRRN